MTPKERAAMQQALEALELVDDGNTWAVHEAITALREALAEPELNLNCKSVQKRLATVWGYVKAEQAEQEPFDMDDHPPHRLCECRKCMEYFTPLPDCDAFAASGKPIAEQTNTQFMEGYRIGLAEMREKCAVICEAKQRYSAMHANTEFATAIRAIKFEGDTGFRPVSEMIAEHKQDPKKAAAIEKAKMRKAEQKPVAVVEITYGREPECYVTGNIDDFPEGVFKLYAAPVRTKDLTDDEIRAIRFNWERNEFAIDFARAVIAADRSKNGII